MDIKTDNQITKDNVRNSETVGRMPIMSDSPSSLFLYKKAERISVAIYLLTNHLSDTEPAKWDTRRLSVNLIEAIVKYVRSDSSDRNVIIRDVSDTVLSLLAILETLGQSGSIAGESVGIVRRELSLFISMAHGELKSIPGAGIVLSDKLFEVAGATVAMKRNGSSMRVRKPTDSPAAKSDNTGTESTHLPGAVTVSGTIQTDIIKKDSHSDRTNAIVNLLRTKSDLTVKDFMGVISGTSEKTIQRELIRLVSIGVLKKQGERRWTRYSLAS